MNLMEMLKQFNSEAKCRKYIEKLRWPNCPICPKCQSEKIYELQNRPLLLCASCKYQFSVTVDTIFHDTHMPLESWFVATFLLCEAKKGMSACQIQRTLGIKTYKTAWYLCHRIRKAMQEVAPKPLTGTVEIDETYIYGKSRRWRSRPGKQVVIGLRQRNGDLRLIRAKDTKSSTVREIIKSYVGRVEVIMTDESMIYPWALRKIEWEKHRTINHSREYAHGDVHTNTVESAVSLLKRGIIGTWHKVDAKHLPAYLDEMCFRFNNRKNPYLFRDTIIKLIHADNLEYKELTAKVQDAA